VTQTMKSDAMNRPVDTSSVSGHYVGQSLKRREDPKYLTGQSHYTDDLTPPGTLYAAIVRSPYAHARIVGINVKEARKRPGVVGVYTGADVRGRLADLPCTWIMPGMKVPVHPVLAFDTVRYAGDGVAVVVAEDRYAAADALDAIEVDYEPLEVVTNQEQAMQPGAPTIHDNVPQNIAVMWHTGSGDFTQAVASAEVHLKQHLMNQPLVPTALEPRAVLAQYTPATQELVLFTSTQAPHLVRRLLAETMNIPEHKLRVIAPDVGGGFGSKLHFYAEEALCAFLARELGRPVKWCETRSENFLATTHGRDHMQEVEIAARRDGTITGLKVTSCANLGAYLSTMSPGIPTFNFGVMVSGTYAIPVIDCTVYGVLTNTTPVDTYRGAGRPEATYLIERTIDLVGREIGMDPAAIRFKNFIPQEAFPFTTAAGITYDSGNYAANLSRALELIGYQEQRRRQEALRQQGRYLGIGISTYVEFCGMSPTRLLPRFGFERGGWESALVRVHPNGTVTVYSGSSAHGQGHETSFAQIAADELGLPIEDIAIVENDTAQVPFGNGTFNSRSMPVGGSAIKQSLEKIIAKAKKIAAHLLKVAEEDILFQDGQFMVRGAHSRKLTFKEASRAAYLASDYPAGLEPGLEEQSFYDPVAFTSPFGSYIAVVEVDAETGAVTIERFVAVDDCGNIVNPMLTAGQVHGGLAQGIGQALFEGVEYDERGQLLTGTLMDYALPRAEDLPTFETDHTVTPTPVNALGVKGIGEAGAIGAPPAIVNAVVDALSPFGIRHLDMPMKGETVWRVIQQARNSE
jgi:aerobic carbon-monoxide dehydrogenase large subunit